MTDSAHPAERAERNVALFIEQEGNGVEILKKGRVIRIAHPDVGHNYLLDVTDAPDETTGDETHAPEVVRDLMKDAIGDPKRWGWSDNNGVISLITDAFSETPQGDARVYIGIQKVDEGDPDAKEVTTHILDKMGFQRRGDYVPFSFDGYEFAQGLIKEELMKLQDDPQWKDDETLKLLTEPTT